MLVALATAPLPASAERSRQPWEALSSPLFSHLTAAQGLPYPIALSLAQDRDGFLWFGTPGGLARWDGYRMQVFRQDNSDPGSLAENIIVTLLADERGNLWAGSISGLVARYDPRQGSFTTYRDHGSGLGRLNGMAGDGAGGLWAVGQFGLAHLNPTTGEWQRERPAGNYSAILRDRGGTLWAASSTALMQRQPAAEHFERVSLPKGLNRLNISALFEDGAGVIWFGTMTGQVGVVNRTTNTAHLIPRLKPSGQRITGIVEPLPGVLWIGEFGGGIRTLDTATDDSRLIRNNPAIPASLADDSVNGLLVDRSGLVWVASVGGADRFNPQNSGVTAILPNAPASGIGSLPGKDVRSMVGQADGKVWLGFRHEGLALLDPVAGRVAAIKPDPTGKGLPKLPVQAIAERTNGDLWAGLSRGLFRIDKASGAISSYARLEVANIRALLLEEPWLWVGGSMGLARIDLRNGDMRLFSNEPDLQDSLSDNSVQAILRDWAGRMWVGTQRGLNLLDPMGGTFQRFLHNPQDPRSLPNDVIHALAEDRTGRIWVATANGIGILATEGDDGQWRCRPLSTADGLNHDTVTMLLEDSAGTMWAGTGNGLSAIDPRSLAVHSLGPADGVGIRTTWAGSGGRMPDGTLLFGGLGGLMVIRPDRIPRWPYRPPVKVTAIKVDGHAVPLPLPNAPIIVAPSDRGFEVEFAALDYSEPGQNRYAYWLDGFDEEWIHTDTNQRKATYTNLPPGHYQLLLHGSNRNGVWSEPPLRLAVLVLPAWYQTWWFRVTGGWIGILGVLGLIHVRTAYLRRRQGELEAQVARRTEELEAARLRALASEEEALIAKEQAVAADRGKSRFLAVASHDIRTPLNGLLGMLQLLDSGPLPPEQRHFLEVAQHSGASLISLIDSILEYGRHEADGDATVIQDFNPRQLAQEVVELFRPQAVANGILLELDTSPDVPAAVRCDRVRLTRILHNLLSNAIKFTPGGMVEVNIAFDLAAPDSETLLRITVTDTGIGIAPEMCEAIFTDFVQADESIAHRFGGTGLGLAICRRAATRMGGRLTVESSPEIGSSFELVIPVEIVPAIAAPAPIRDDGPSLSLLLVDDDEINRQVGGALLRRLGHTVTLASDAPSAVTAAAEEDFDLILMDLNMPGIDGIEASHRIRALPNAHRAGVPIIAVTAGLGQDTRDRCAQAGINRVIMKPLRLETLHQTLISAVRDEANIEKDGPAPRTGLTTTEEQANEAPESGLLDVAFLTSQWDILGGAEMIRLGRLFHRTSRGLLATLDQAAATGDRATLRAVAHRLTSAAGALGLARLSAQTHAIDRNAETAEKTELETLVATLRPLRARSMTALLALARGLPPTPARG